MNEKFILSLIQLFFSQNFLYSRYSCLQFFLPCLLYKEWGYRKIKKFAWFCFYQGLTIVLYDLLCSETQAQINARFHCPLHDSCLVRHEIGEDYICKTAPWDIIKNEKKITCQYGMAAHSFGLWQNNLDIKIDK